MGQQRLKVCADSHDAVFYTKEDCPVCIVRKQMDEQLDEQEDIHTENINLLFKELKIVRHRLKQVERHSGVGEAGAFLL